jgi:hypothetical protein
MTVTFELHAVFFDLRGTAKSRYFAHARVHHRPMYGPLAFGISQVHRLVHDLQTPFVMAELLELRVKLPQNDYALSRSHLPFCTPPQLSQKKQQALQKHGISYRMT